MFNLQKNKIKTQCANDGIPSELSEEFGCYSHETFLSCYTRYLLSTISTFQLNLPIFRGVIDISLF